MKKRNHGRDDNYFKKLTFSNTDWNEDSDFTIQIIGQFSFSLLNEGDEIIEYSFNGNNLHGDMTPGKPSAGMTFDNRRISAIWVRSPSGNPTTLRVEAWVAAD